MNKNLLIAGLTVMVNLIFAQPKADMQNTKAPETNVKQIPWQMIRSSDESVPVSKIQMGEIYLNSDSLTQIPDVQASFPGGQGIFYEYLRNTLVYPMRCMDDAISGTVRLRFIVDNTGSIRNITVVEEIKICKEFTVEAIRVLKNSPRWVPAQIKGRFVNSWMIIPVRFSLE